MNLHPQLKLDLASESAKVTPPVAILGVSAGGITLQDWVYIVTLVYLSVQIGWLLWKWWVAYRTKGWSPKDGT